MRRVRSEKKIILAPYCDYESLTEVVTAHCAKVPVTDFTWHVGFSFVGMAYSTTSSVEYKNGYTLLSV